MMYQDAESRYYHDAFYRTLVDFLHQQMIEMQLTPGEIRDAAMLAAIKFEQTKDRIIYKRKGGDL